MINPYIGEVTVFAFNFAPAGWITCQGQLLPVDEYKQLFAAIGNSFGGNGVSTFGLPNFGSLTDEGGQYCMSLFGQPRTGTNDALPGEIGLLPYAPPPNWINCDGQILPIAQNAALYAVLGATFGGNGTSTFGIPNLTAVPPLLPASSPSLPPTIYSIANVHGDCSAEGFLGEVVLFPLTVPPKNWLPCEGQVLPVGSSDTALYSLLGNTYGGDGETTFGLPDFSKLSPPGLEYFICTVGLYPSH